jgi:hypothetical protein
MDLQKEQQTDVLTFLSALTPQGFLFYFRARVSYKYFMYRKPINIDLNTTVVSLTLHALIIRTWWADMHSSCVS